MENTVIDNIRYNLITHVDDLHVVYDTIHSDSVDNLRDKHIYVAWSGGWDSTAILVYMAYKYGTPEKPIIALELECENIPQWEVERECRNKMKEIFTGLGLNIIYASMSTSVTYNNDFKKECYTLFSGQAPIMANLAVLVHNTKRAVIVYGYVFGDSIFNCWHEFKDIVKSVGKLLGQPNLPILFPLADTTKETIYRYLEDIGLLPYCWYCENPVKNEDGTYTPCGTCLSCTRVQNILTEDTQESSN